MTVDELRARRVAKLAAALERAAAAFHALDQPGSEPTRQWWAAGCAREEAIGRLTFDAPDHPLIRRERQRDAEAIAAARERLAQQWAGRIHQSPLTPDGWARLARTPAHGPLRGHVLRRLTGKLLAAGLDPHLVAELMHSHNAAVCRPPLTRADVDRLVDHVCDRHADRIEAGA